MKLLHRLSLFLLVFIYSYNFVNAQKPSIEEKRIFKKARKLLAKEKYKDAQLNYLKLVDINPNSDIYNFEAGLSYYFSDFERSKSIPLFEAALKNSSEDTIPELKYYLGRAYHLNGQFEKSKITLNEFTPFIRQETRAGQELLQETNYRIKLNETGLQLDTKKNDNIKVKNLGNSINTADREYAPVYRKDENII